MPLIVAVKYHTKTIINYGELSLIFTTFVSISSSVWLFIGSIYGKICSIGAKVSAK